MTGVARRLMFLMHGGAEISWIYACTSFATAAVIGRSLPYAAALAAFAGGTAVAHLSLGRGLRKGLVLLIQMVGVMSIGTVLLHAMYYPSSPLFSAGWLRVFLKTPRPPVQWAEMVFMLLSFLLFWIGGICLWRRNITYETACSRFDIGLGSLFCLFLMKLAILFKGGPISGSGPSLYPAFSFLLLAILAIAMSRSKQAGSKAFLEGYGLAGIVAGFLGAVLLAVALVFIFLLPVLNRVAGAGYGVVKTASGFAAPFLVSAVRFLFGPREIRSEPASTSPKSTGLGHVLAPDTWWAHYLQPAMEWMMRGFVVAVLLFSAALLLYCTVVWLLGRTGREKRKARPVWNPLSWLFYIETLVASLLVRVLSYFRDYRRIGDVYGGLLSWGRRSGLAPAPSDTPSGFGSRLSRHFPPLARHITLIVSAFNREIYGGKVLTATEFASARVGLRTLGRARYWPRRLRKRLEMYPSRQAGTVRKPPSYPSA